MVVDGRGFEGARLHSVSVAGRDRRAECSDSLKVREAPPVGGCERRVGRFDSSMTQCLPSKVVWSSFTEGPGGGGGESRVKKQRERGPRRDVIKVRCV